MGVITDQAILRFVRERAPEPMPAEQLAECCGLAPDEMSLRMLSLVSLRYVERDASANHDAYALGPTSLDSAGFAGDLARVLKIAGTSPAAA